MYYYYESITKMREVLLDFFFLVRVTGDQHWQICYWSVLASKFHNGNDSEHYVVGIRNALSTETHILPKNTFNFLLCQNYLLKYIYL